MAQLDKTFPTNDCAMCILSPKLVLIDEPTSHQDLQRTQDVLSAIRRAVERGTACLAATHSGCNAAGPAGEGGARCTAA